jgi:DNA-binding Xre family transcriptional regulator
MTVTPIRITLRDARKNARNGKGLTQVELAELAGVRPATISDLESTKRERGTRRLVDLDVIEKICRVLELEPGDLLVLEDDPKPPQRKR